MTSANSTTEENGSAPKAVELSIIIVNWNSLEYLCESLRSIFTTTTTTTTRIEFEIIVVDNASSADEAGAVQAQYPDVIVMRNGKNLGFAGANNLGYGRASGKYLLFLNPDTRVIGSAIAVMLAYMKSLERAGILGCRLLNSDGSLQTSCIQRFPTILNQMLDVELLRLRWPNWRIWGIAPLFSGTQQPTEVEVISGACLMIAREAFEQAGKFNEQYFMYAEDVELCYQVHRLGWRVYYTGAATVVHHGGGASKWQKGKEWVAVMQRQAIMRFCRKAHGRLYAAAYRAAMAFNALCRLALLSILLPVRRLSADKQLVYSGYSKWLSVLKWAIGFDRRFVSRSV